MVKKILMCRPDYFCVDYDINPWMTENIGAVDRDLAIQQWTELYTALKSAADVHLIPPVPSLPDMVFTANAGYYDKTRNTVFLSKFLSEQRQGEEIHFYKWFTKKGYNVFQTNLHFEGEGDLLKNTYAQHWVGYGFRSNKKVHENWPFSELPNFRKLHLVDKRFYHLDTCLAPLGREGGVLWFPGAFSSSSQEKIRKYSVTKHSIEVTEEEALTFCCNAVIIDNLVFMPRCATVAEKLKAFGYTVKQFEMSEFLKSGGACKCLTMFI